MAATPKSTQTLSISTTSAEFTNPVEVGHKYILTASVDCFFKVGVDAGDAATTDMPLWSKQYLEIEGDDSGELYIKVITASGSGTAYLTLVD